MDGHFGVWMPLKPVGRAQSILCFERDGRWCVPERMDPGDIVIFRLGAVHASTLHSSKDKSPRLSLEARGHFFNTGLIILNNDKLYFAAHTHTHTCAMGLTTTHFLFIHNLKQLTHHFGHTLPIHTPLKQMTHHLPLERLVSDGL